MWLVTKDTTQIFSNGSFLLGNMQRNDGQIVFQAPIISSFDDVFFYCMADIVFILGFFSFKTFQFLKKLCSVFFLTLAEWKGLFVGGLSFVF